MKIASKNEEVQDLGDEFAQRFFDNLHADFSAGDRTEFAKRLLQIFVADRVRQIADVKFVAHEDSLKTHKTKAMGSRRHNKPEKYRRSARNEPIT